MTHLASARGREKRKREGGKQWGWRGCTAAASPLSAVPSEHVAHAARHAVLPVLEAARLDRGLVVQALVALEAGLMQLLEALDAHGALRGVTPLALLRAGTMNTVANALEVARLPAEALARKVLDAAHSGAPLAVRERATIDVGGRLAFLFGTGVFRNFLDEYYAAGPDPSPLTAATTLARIASSIVARGPLAARLVARESLHVRADDASWGRGPFLTVAAGTVLTPSATVDHVRPLLLLDSMM